MPLVLVRGGGLLWLSDIFDMLLLLSALVLLQLLMSTSSQLVSIKKHAV